MPKSDPKSRYIKPITFTEKDPKIYFSLPKPWLKLFKWIEMADVFPNGMRQTVLEVYPVIVIKEDGEKKLYRTGFLILNYGEKWREAGEDGLPTYGGEQCLVVKIVSKNK